MGDRVILINVFIDMGLFFFNCLWTSSVFLTCGQIAGSALKINGNIAGK